MARRRRHKTREQEPEDDLPERRNKVAQWLSKGFSDEDRRAWERCRQLREGGYGSVEWNDLLGEK